MRKILDKISIMIDQKPINVLIILLSIQLIFRLIIFFTTNTFAFTDWRVYLAGIEQIKNGQELPLFSRAFTFLLSYIGYFFKYILGNLDYFFVLNCILGVLVSFVSFLIVKEITDNYRKALLVVALQSIYIDFLSFSSIFYTVIIMLLFVNLIIYLMIKYFREDKISRNVFYILLLVVLIFSTFFLKIELKFFGIFLLFFSLFFIKNKILIFRVLIIALIITLTTSLTTELIKSMNPAPATKIDFIFFGHTFYGGKGGEGAFIFKENQELHDRKMKEYFNENKIDSPISADTGRFQKHEMFNFILNEPHKWMLLQARKFFFTFGIVPEGNSFTILFKGLFNRNFLLTSASETYGTAQYVPIDENHPSVGQSPYSASKISADQIAVSYYRSFNLPVKIIRPFNTYGPRQSARAIIPSIITQILSGIKDIKAGNLHPTRDFTFVKDTVKGFIEIFKSSQTIGEVINIGMSEEISIADLIKKISSLMDSGVNVNIDDIRIRPENSEVDRLMCNNEKIRRLTNWIPEYDLTKGLIETIDWIKNNLSHYKADVYNV